MRILYFDIDTLRAGHLGCYRSANRSFQFAGTAIETVLVKLSFQLDINPSSFSSNLRSQKPDKSKIWRYLFICGYSI
jgi:hypothetical protein